MTNHHEFSGIDNTHLWSRSFHELEVAWLSWVLCSRSVSRGYNAMAARAGVSFEAQSPHPSFHGCWQNSLPCSLLLQGLQDLLWSQKRSKPSFKEFDCVSQAHPGKSQTQQIRYLNYICKNSFSFAIQCNLSKEWRPSNSHVPSTLKGTEVYKGHWRSS